MKLKLTTRQKRIVELSELLDAQLQVSIDFQKRAAEAHTMTSLLRDAIADGRRELARLIAVESGVESSAKRGASSLRGS